LKKVSLYIVWNPELRVNSTLRNNLRHQRSLHSTLWLTCSVE